MAHDAIAQLAQVVRDSGLVPPGSRGVALLSGGPDSACLAAGLAAALGADAISGLHVNYGFRPDSGEDEDAARGLCERLELDLDVKQVRLDTESANLQAAARDARYEIGENLRARLGADWIATGHTRSDLAETVLYRLASSPGRRAMLGLAPRRGYLVRPLLALGRAETRRLATEAELPFHDDPSNVDPGFARVRVREQVLPVLREINPAVEENVAATWAELAEEAEALEALATEALEATAPPPTTAVQVERLAELAPAIRRLALRKLAERAAGHEVALGKARAEEIWRLGNQPEGGEIELPGGLKAICEAGVIRFATATDEAEPEPAELPVPGSCRFGRWEIHAEVRPGPVEPLGPEIATLDAAALGSWLEVRAWREGDRMRPLGLDGSKSLQDLFTDHRVPRSLRHGLPVVVAGDRIAWVAGVAVSEDFRLSADSTEAAVLTASLTPG